ncbi:carboxymuconolactone decarboxylase family protein [Anaeroselena agilis]|uniref:Carboxymuconolactone decarboxylase family protein n=1 Tax=Anaeroselena agilis TaxID=3063788 RepID=A0ABU3NXY9_9FIRM|nr:carboxymuconolactone decarboxylase family protein [Selenomonadales bacterium 4137-cl]
MSLDKRTQALVSVGASVAANCHPCLEYHSARARETGLTDQEILAAAEAGRAVRAGAAKSMDQLITRLLAEKPATAQPGCGGGCNC